jgi:hypothetical protein
MYSEDKISAQLDKLIRLTSIQVTKDLTLKDQILLLAKAGFPPKDIADLVGTTPNAVSVTLYQGAKKASKAKAGGNGQS